MIRINLDIPEGTLAALQLSGVELAEALLIAAAMKFFEQGRLSSGSAAELAGVPKPLFLARLSAYGVATFRQTEDELRSELRQA